MAQKVKLAQLAVEKRQVTGRKVKKLRTQGILPANIYGRGIKSLAVSLPLKDFAPVYEQAGETGLVEIKVKGETKVRPTLIHNLQLDPVSDRPLHADFFQVNLKEKVASSIPVELVGEAPAVAQNVGVLIQPLTAIEVEALPTDLPDKFEVDISGLKQINDAIAVADLKVPTGVKIMVASQEILAKIDPFAKEEEPAAPAAEEAEAVPEEGQEAPPAQPEAGAKSTEKPAEKPADAAPKK